MKKTLGLILILLLMFSLLGCSSKDDGLSEENNSAYKGSAYHAIYDAQEVQQQQQAVVDGFLIMPVHENRMDANVMDGEAKEEDL